MLKEKKNSISIYTMTRRCSICSSSNHSKRTCSTAGEGGVRLFGVRLTDGSSVKKSASMGNLSHFSSATDDLPEGYHSEDPALVSVSASASARQEMRRKKAVPWTIAEHRQFLVGLENFGKGDWRNISRSYVPSKTPSQVASHAQKYFLHQSNAAKRKRRSLFDVVADMDTNSLAMPLASGIGNGKVTMPSSRVNNPVHSLDLSLKPVIMPLPFQLWPPPTSSSGKELIGISRLTLEDTKTIKIEPSPLSLRQPGEL